MSLNQREMDIGKNVNGTRAIYQDGGGSMVKVDSVAGTGPRVFFLIPGLDCNFWICMSGGRGDTRCQKTPL